MADAAGLKRAWWASWREKNFSWDGLAEIQWAGWSKTPAGEIVPSDGAPEGSVDAMLQDYWRDEQTRLVEHDGARWTLAHVPEEAKAEWNEEQRAQLDDILTRKLAASGTTAFENGKRVGPDRRAQFQGVVFLETPHYPEREDKPFSVNCADGAFLESVFFFDSTFERDCDFSRALFCGDASFRSSAFKGNARFAEARFLAACRFAATSMADTAYFQFATALGYANFRNASFKNGASFEGMTFENFADFEHAILSGRTGFVRAKFEDYSDFRFAEFGNTDFTGAIFSRNGNFTSAVFKGVALFIQTAFAAAVSFESAQFQKQVTFVGEGHAPLKPEQRQQLSVDEIATDADVGATARFGALVTPATLQAIARSGFQRCSFRNAVFCDDVDFSNRAFTAESYFDGAEFRGVPMFHDSTICQGVRLNGANFATAWQSTDDWVAAILKDAKAQRRLLIQRAQREGLPRPDLDALPNRDQLLDDRFAKLEHAYRTLKLSMENIRDREREQLFYRFELICRRRQRATRATERATSRLYALFSNYGGSVGRPFLWLIAVTLLFAVVYWGWGRGLQGAHLAPLGARLAFDPNFWDAFLFSWGNVFRPFGAWSSEYAQTGTPWLQSFLDGGGDALQRLFIRLTASAQSVSAIILIFLLGLAVRRRFQIN